MRSRQLAWGYLQGPSSPPRAQNPTPKTHKQNLALLGQH